MNFQNPTPKKPTLSRAQYLLQVSSAARDLILFAALSAVNLVLILTNASISFTFSAYIPEFLVGLGLLVKSQLSNSAPLYLFGAVSVVYIGLCLLSGILANKKKDSVWLYVGTALVVLDSAVLLWGIVVSLAEISYYLIYILFHIWILATLFRGLAAKAKLKNVPPEPQTYDVPFTVNPVNSEDTTPTQTYTLNGNELPKDDDSLS